MTDTYFTDPIENYDTHLRIHDKNEICSGCTIALRQKVKELEQRIRELEELTFQLRTI